MTVKYFLFIEPDDYEKPRAITKIVLKTYDGYTIFDGEANRRILLRILRAMDEGAYFITYDGFLLYYLIYKIFEIDYRKIINLMTIFSRIYKSDSEKYWGDLIYWKDLQDALAFYNNKSFHLKSRVDGSNADDIVQKTIILYYVMLLWHGKELMESEALNNNLTIA